MTFVKIKKITKLVKKVPVYDIIGVPDNHNFIANNMVVHNCDVYTRGSSAIFVRDSNPVSDSWKLKDFQKIGSYNEFTAPEKIKERLSKHSNFWTIMKIPKVPEKLYEAYLKVREHNVYDETTVMANVGKEDIYNAFLIMALKDIMGHDSTYSMNRIILHIKNEYETTLSKQTVSDCLNDAQQLIQKIKEQAVDVNNFEKMESLTEVQMVTDMEEDDMDDIEEEEEKVVQAELVEEEEDKDGQRDNPEDSL